MNWYDITLGLVSLTNLVLVVWVLVRVSSDASNSTAQLALDHVKQHQLRVDQGYRLLKEKIAEALSSSETDSREKLRDILRSGYLDPQQPNT